VRVRALLSHMRRRKQAGRCPFLRYVLRSHTLVIMPFRLLPLRAPRRRHNVGLSVSGFQSSSLPPLSSGRWCRMSVSVHLPRVSFSENACTLHKDAALISFPSPQAPVRLAVPAARGVGDVLRCRSARATGSLLRSRLCAAARLRRFAGGKPNDRAASVRNAHLGLAPDAQKRGCGCGCAGVCAPASLAGVSSASPSLSAAPRSLACERCAGGRAPASDVSGAVESEKRALLSNSPLQRTSWPGRL